MSTNELPASLQGEIEVLMIDNFDSFTWNLYQQISLQGVKVTVIRNDAIVAEQLPLLKIKRLIISPGPGHPKTDSGISNAAIAYFEGKVPILGVCMGLECLVDLHGGTIAYAGEIMHGKVSSIRHDGRGCFRGVPQGIKSIRYHSLSAAHTTLPADLAITSATEESGVIMGVRHRKYTVEAVQYHPESILSEGGDELIKNFLSLNGGTWEENPHVHVLDNTLPPFPYEALPPELAKSEAKSKLPTILERIYAQRLADVAQAQSTPGSTLADLETLIASNIAPPLISFLDRVSDSTPQSPSLFAEIKRASPSKGPISVSTSPATQALTYALAGAHTISVLTEPKWFLGSLHDMLHARMSVAHLSNRPAILRKDFILSRYQVLESRIWGADTLLLIVSMLPEPLLRDLYAYSVSLGMEPLVEVNNAKEMEIALSLPAKVIGVNNRNLHNFEVDMNTTSRLSDMVAGKDIILLALSGIFGPEDVQRYAADGVRGVLVGESLMRAKDPAAFIRHLLSQPKLDKVPEPEWRNHSPLVKICGIKSPEEAVAVANAGADMLGLIFVEKSKRFVDVQTARAISHAVKDVKFAMTHLGYDDESNSDHNPKTNTPWLTTNANRVSRTTHAERPLLVGVFQNAPLETILSTVSLVQPDIVQLHGSEPIEWAHRIPVPVIKVFHVGKEEKGVAGITRGGAHQFVLLDSLREDGMSGGTGKTFDWDLAKKVVEDGEVPKPKKQGTPATGSANGASTPTPESTNGEVNPADIDQEQGTLYFPLPIILAGGLTADNVEEAIAHVRPWAVDVSGGVETDDGVRKDIAKVKAFINAVKGVGEVEDPPPSEPVSESGDEGGQTEEED